MLSDFNIDINSVTLNLIHVIQTRVIRSYVSEKKKSHKKCLHISILPLVLLPDFLIYNTGSLVLKCNNLYFFKVFSSIMMDNDQEDGKKLRLLKNAFNLIEIYGIGKTGAHMMIG